VRRPVAQFAVAGLVVLAVFGGAALLALRQVAHDEALRDARQFAVLAGQGIVEPALDASLLRRDAAAVDAVDRVVNERVLSDRILRVKLWAADGRVVYSDEPRLIGERFALDDAKRQALRDGSAAAERADLTGPENRFEQGLGDLYEVYVPVRAPDGTPLLFETYQRRAAVEATGRRIWLPFAALLLASLLLLWLVQVPLAWRLGRDLQRTTEEREALLVRAIEASVDERRRIASDLHDGPVQELAGISYTLSAAAEAEASPGTRATLRDAAAATREAMRSLRSLLLEIHPPNLRASGLEPALGDLLARLEARGVATNLSIESARLTEDDERLVYRAAAEALRNVERHADATAVDVSLRTLDGVTRLEVRDDGAGFASEDRERRREEGHVGLSLIEELAERAGARVEVRSAPGGGTTFALEVPHR
jgi:signal transduction histidine kinase